MFTFEHDDISIQIDPRDCYVDADIFVVFGHVSGGDIDGRLVGVVSASGDFDYAVEAMTDDGSEGDDLGYRLPKHVYQTISRVGRRALAKPA